MVSYKKLKNIIKYSSFVELAINSNIIFADNNKKSGFCGSGNTENKSNEEKNDKTPVQTPVQNQNSKDQKKQQLINECNNLITQIKKLDSNFNKTVNEGDSIEKLTELKNELTTKLAELKIKPGEEKPGEDNPGDKDKDKEEGEEDKEDPKGKVDISKITVEEYVDKISAFKNKKVQVETLKEYINIVIAKFDEYKKRLAEIVKSVDVKTCDYSKALTILKEYNNIASDIDTALIFPHLNQYSVFKDLEEKSKEGDFVLGIRTVIDGIFEENIEKFEEDLKSIIKKHNEDELKKQIDKKNLQDFVDKLDEKLPYDFSFESSEGTSRIYLIDNDDKKIKYGEYSSYGGGSIYLYGFDFYIKLEDFHFFYNVASKLKLDEYFAKDRRLLACHFHSRIVGSDNLILLIDLTNKDFFTKNNAVICYLEYDKNKACLTDGNDYDEDSYDYIKGETLKYKKCIENDKFNYEYLNSSFLWSKNEKFDEKLF